jgi:2-polyprenyl-3-methyl-5-hydroxy-6-metoxy-1,4-benzoquinol methylase
MHIVTNFEQLDAALNEAHVLQGQSDDAFRRYLAGVRMQLSAGRGAPADPFGEDYRQFQSDVYARIAQKPYALVNEETEFNPEDALRWPFPYASRSAQLVGDYLVSYGFFIKMMNLPANATILEMGSGYGPLTAHLASMGYQVTCLDISQNLLDFVKRRTSNLPTPVQTVCGDMTTATIDGTFDAVVFYESFHHCLDHLRLLARLPALLKPGGIVAFAAEPIVPDDSPLVPYPWGLRMDGLSLWSIRRWSWMELGFRESYFRDMLLRAGWRVQRHRLGYSGLNDVWIASLAGAGGKAVEYEATTMPDAEAELKKLRALVAGYERGKFIRFSKWLREKMA